MQHMTELLATDINGIKGYDSGNHKQALPLKLNWKSQNAGKTGRYRCGNGIGPYA